jgi:hypothetical protein
MNVEIQKNGVEAYKRKRKMVLKLIKERSENL